MADDLSLNLNLAGLGINLSGSDLSGLLGGGGKGGLNVGGLRIPDVELARFALVAGVAATALTAVAAAAKFASERLIQAGQTGLSLGSSTGQGMFLSTLGGAFGIGNVAGSAAALHQATLSGLGAMHAGRAGIPIRPVEIGDGTNRGEMLIRALEHLRSLPRGEAISAARNLNIEEWLPVLYVMDETWQKLRREMEAAAGTFSEDRIRQAAEFNVQMAMFQTKLQELGVTLGSLVLPGLTTGIDFLTRFIKNIQTHGDPRVALGKTVQEMLSESKSASLDANTKALNQNTSELENLQGFFGGGRRFRSGLPEAFIGPGGGAQLNEALRGSAQHWGAFPVGM